MGFTDDWYTDGRVSSVRPSVIISPTDFIAVTDGISLSVKLDNVVVCLGQPWTKKHGMLTSSWAWRSVTCTWKMLKRI
jgi:hypothetical protein